MGVPPGYVVENQENYNYKIKKNFKQIQKRTK